MKKSLESVAKKLHKSSQEFNPSTAGPSHDIKTLRIVNNKIAKHYKEIYLEENKNLSEKIKEAIHEGHVITGMTRGQVTASRGSPYKINKTTSAAGIYEQWIMYPLSGPIHDTRKDKEYGYIYFKNGKVSGWQSW